MQKFININNFNELKLGDHIKCNISTNYENIYINNIIKEGFIYKLGTSINDTIIKDKKGNEINFNYLNNQINISIQKN